MKDKNISLIQVDRKIHWLESQDKRFLGHQDLPNGDDLVLTIAEGGFSEIINPKTNETTIELIIIFKEKNIKPMIVNATNAKMILKCTKTNFVQDAVGKKIQIGVSQTKVKKEVIDCLRVREVLSSELDKLITQEQIDEIRNLLSNLEGIFSETEMLKFLKRNSIEEIQFEKFEGIKTRLMEKINAKQNN